MYHPHIIIFAGLEKLKKLEKKDFIGTRELFARMKIAVNGALAILSEAPPVRTGNDARQASSASGQQGAGDAGAYGGLHSLAQQQSPPSAGLSSWNAERVQSWLQEKDIDFLCNASASPPDPTHSTFAFFPSYLSFFLLSLILNVICEKIVSDICSHVRYMRRGCEQISLY